jgi:hypothetical protein
MKSLSSLKRSNCNFPFAQVQTFNNLVDALEFHGAMDDYGRPLSVVTRVPDALCVVAHTLNKLHSDVGDFYLI